MIALEGVPDDAAVLTCGQVAQALNFRHQFGGVAGKPNRGTVRKLTRAGSIPPPIDATLALAHWRWSRTLIELYVAGGWVPTAPLAEASK